MRRLSAVSAQDQGDIGGVDPARAVFGVDDHAIAVIGPVIGDNGYFLAIFHVKDLVSIRIRGIICVHRIAVMIDPSPIILIQILAVFRLAIERGYDLVDLRIALIRERGAKVPNNRPPGSGKYRRR